VSLAYGQSQVDARLRIGDAVEYQGVPCVVDALYLKYDVERQAEEEYACLQGLYRKRYRKTVATTKLLKGEE
jgi:hypothetical protein